MAKRARLDEIIGTLREKEVLGNSDTGSLLFPPLFFFINLLVKLIFVSVCTASFFS